MKNLIVILTFVLLLASCSFYKVDSDISAGKFYPSKETTSQVTYLEVISRDHEIIGTVTVNAERNQRLVDVIEKMKREAAVMGGDAVTNIRTNAGDGKWAQIKPKNFFRKGNVRANFIADVVVFISGTNDGTTSAR